MHKTFTSLVENNQLIDEIFTMNYIKSELNNKNLEKYNNGIYFNDKTDFLAGYNYNKEFLIFNLKKIKNLIVSTLPDKQINNNKEALNCNITMLHVINHELSHIMQKAIIMDNYVENELIKSLIEESIYYQKNSKLYNKYHDKYIIEYNSNLKGLINTKKFIENTKYNCKNINDLIINYINKSYYNMSPVEKFNKIIGKENNVSKYYNNPFYTQLTNNEIELYGLPKKTK
ncbi:MAG: hypothetical protein MR411_04305 [Tenericutes bacterium]|nr:hypothetical protein [Mycoplasmatota bacterium]